MERLTDISVIKGIMERYGFSFSKALGQNFITNPAVCPKIASMGGADENTGVIEIGPGFGVLTNELCRTAKKVVAIELDDRLIPILGETLAEYDNVKVINADVMKTDLKALIGEEFEGMDVAVCANLPYYITTPIIMYLLEERLPVKSVTVMVQKEAGVRICAPLATRESGAVSFAVRYYSEPRLLFNVSRGSFMPAPDVDSCVIRLDILKEPPVKVRDEKFFFSVVRGAFSQRRKTLANSLSSALSLDKNTVNSAIAAAVLPPNVRPEQLDMEGMAAVADALYELKL
ncbi:MAG: 16S rRNA (adenine(1518)-N(6)/adenine(1519)-N(6))-dimethyltransferase RsmA [Oscillospiraceae bacterium]|nr:16S rRNA (adenine(1518)-N(6)/adenine(1519)-N(6))-dimethyltransferase RsmA [Oscillospiraceae bacterium]